MDQETTLVVQNPLIGGVTGPRAPIDCASIQWRPQTKSPKSAQLFRQPQPPLSKSTKKPELPEPSVNFM